MDPRPTSAGGSRRPLPGEPGGRTFLQKLAIYMTGIAIGLMLLGWFQYRKGLAVRAQQATQESLAEPDDTGSNEAGSNGRPSAAASDAPGASEQSDLEVPDEPEQVEDAEPDGPND